MEASWQIALDRTLLTFEFAEHLLMGFALALLSDALCSRFTPIEEGFGTGR